MEKAYTSKNPMIPYTGIFLTDLVFLNDSWKTLDQYVPFDVLKKIAVILLLKVAVTFTCQYSCCLNATMTMPLSYLSL